MVFEVSQTIHSGVDIQTPALNPASVGIVAGLPFGQPRAELGTTLLAGARRSLRLTGTSQANRLLGGPGDDQLRGRGGDDTLRGLAGNDQLWGEAGRDLLEGGRGNDILNGGGSRARDRGQRAVPGRTGDVLLGGDGDDVLIGSARFDRLTGGNGRDRFVIQGGIPSGAANAITQITDFTKGQDVIQLGGGLSFENLQMVQGSGSQANSTLIQNKQTGETLVMLRGIPSSSLDPTDFGSALPPTPSPVPLPAPVVPPSPTPPSILPVAAISPTTIKFSPDSSEAAIAATGAARIQLGSQTIYIGTQQVTSINQNPIIASFDSSNPSNNWVRTNYEVTGTDGRGYGLFWSGSHLYGVFSVDGTQGTPDQDFRRVSGGASQAWLRSYGSGGGAKVAVLARLNPATGEMTEAAYLSAILSNGRSNSLAVTGLTVNEAGNIVVSAQSYFAPRRPDGRPMTQTTPGNSPFDYTLEITPDLKTVVRTAAVGWS